MGSIAVFLPSLLHGGVHLFLGSNAYFYSKGPVYWTAIAWNILFGIMYFVIGKRIWFYGKENNYITASDFFAHQYDSEFLANLVAIIMLLFTLPTCNSAHRRCLSHRGSFWRTYSLENRWYYLLRRHHHLRLGWRVKSCCMDRYFHGILLFRNDFCRFLSCR